MRGPATTWLTVQRWYLGFHNTLTKAAHNEFLEKAMATIRGEMFVGVPPEGDQPSPEELMAAHRAIFEAVRDQDAARARQTADGHHEFLYRFLWVTEPEQSE